MLMTPLTEVEREFVGTREVLDIDEALQEVGRKDEGDLEETRRT